MSKYILKRCLYILPTLLIVLIALFFIKSSISKDPIDFHLSSISDLQPEENFYEQEYLKLAKKMGYDRPTFYFSIVPKSFPDKLHEIFPLAKRWEIKKQARSHGLTLPKFSWHGPHNQFHLWIGNLLKGDLGDSVVDGKSVAENIAGAMKWTLLLMLISIFFSLVISLPLGYWMAQSGSGLFKWMVEKISFLFFTVPLFWLCMLSVIFLTSNYYGIQIFPSVGINPNVGQMSFWQSIVNYGNKLILPSLCWVLHSMAYIMMQLKTSLREQESMEYVRTAMAKGLNRNQISWKHMLKNALLPMITIYFSTIPKALAGSLVIETIFNIPGMGRLMVSAVSSSDWNVVFGVVIISTVITIISYLIADVLYARINPKIKYEAYA